MKYLFAICLLIVSIIGFTQSSFEGKVVYRLTGPGQNGRITMWFSKPGLRMEFTDTVNGNKIRSLFITNFDSGKSYSLSLQEKVYTENLLIQKSTKKLPLSKEIAGFNTVPTHLSSGGFSNRMRSFESDVIYYPASDLYFEVPELYIDNSELMMVQENKILLGIEYYINASPEWDFKPHGDTLRKFREVYTAMAYEVISEKLNATLFVPPLGFIKKDEFLNTEDSLIRSSDSIKTSRQIPTKEKKSSPKKKSSSKPNATRRKED